MNIAEEISKGLAVTGISYHHGPADHILSDVDSLTIHKDPDLSLYLEFRENALIYLEVQKGIGFNYETLYVRDFEEEK